MSILRSFGEKTITFTQKAATFVKAQAEANLAISNLALKVLGDEEVTSKFLDSLEELEEMVASRIEEITSICTSKYSEEFEEAEKKINEYIETTENLKKE